MRKDGAMFESKDGAAWKRAAGYSDVGEFAQD
jgi:hypothetical protein